MVREKAPRWQDYRRTRRLNMLEAAEVLGWTTGTTSAARRTRDRLRRVEALVGVRVLYGAGKKGSANWTTMSALRNVGLVDDIGELLGEAKHAQHELFDRVAVLERCVRLMTAEISKLGSAQRETADGVQRYFAVVGEYDHRRFREIVSAELPASVNSETKRLPGRPKGRRDLSPRKPPKRRKKKSTKVKRVVVDISPTIDGGLSDGE